MTSVAPLELHPAPGGPNVPAALDCFALADIAMCVTDAFGRIRDVNNAFALLVGTDSDELIDRPIAELLDPEGHQELQPFVSTPKWRPSDVSKKVARIKFTRPDGRHTWINLSRYGLVDDHGIVTGIFVQAHDVTALVSAEDEVRRLETGQRIAHLGSFEQDPESGVLEGTAELKRLLGIEADGPIFGAQLMMVVHPDDREGLGEAIEACCKEHTPVDIVHRLVLADGTTRWVHALAEWSESGPSGRPCVFGTIIDVTDRKVAEDSLLFEYMHDNLTGLANRTSFLNIVERSLAIAKYQARHLAVLLLDVDDFKTVNDSLGHAAGDQLLVDLSHRLGAIARNGDTIARFGGDEFAILIESGDARTVAQQVATRIASTLRVPFIVAGHDIEISASIGIAVSDMAGEAGELLRDADLAMYVAKQRGKCRFELADAGMHESALERLTLISDLRHGVEHSEFEVYYQPIIDTRTSSIAGVEALVRWNHPRRGLLLPASFLELAETSGLIVPIGQKVRRDACRQLASWRKGGLVDDDFYVSVNLSPRQLAEPNLVTNVVADLKATDLPAAVLILEITESALMGEFDAVNARLTELKAMGLRIALDDYGTGYSSLARLSSLPIDIIKIDKSFVDQVCSSAEALVLVKSVVDVAKALGQSTIAEGVEDEDQFGVLKEIGATYIQGYLFAKPMPVRKVELVITTLRKSRNSVVSTANGAR